MALILLVGGQSRRMGKDIDKPFLPFSSDKSLIEYLIDKYKTYFSNIIVVGKTKEKYNHLSKIEFVKDIFDAGPLGGIHAGLEASNDKFNFVTACDMPFVKLSLIKYFEKVAASQKKELIITKKDNYFEPLCALYNKKIVPVIKENIKENKLSLKDLIIKLEKYVVLENELIKIDPEKISFFNINTSNDYKKAVQIIKKGKLIV